MKIVPYPHPALRTKAEPVKAIDKDLHLLVGRMFELMYEHEGLGLAAPQVAQGVQVLVMNFTGSSKNPDTECVAINPVILESKGSVEDREGCLSFPGLFQRVRRAKQVKVQAYNLKGELYEMTCSDLIARIWQHEIDHLNGMLFIDKMSMLAKLAAKPEIEAFKADFDKALRKGDYPPGIAPKF
ncbi:peptide deformylase [Tuwongella immobilis]|uniref:Peptide deformylase n=1 Tax=Tuwongella immobilis TaxID=692036 RepID=A0A6C2YV63_9BACT|nr:peptide deformylase [Tuwongella immobilis]VIP05053.1 peptide deformylase : Peptide deformylase OS=Isosphaera pallida (strain ATCC 43644 / DSM 9630 / IS1B) GN=def PE=3 SV=1: Pep_deformylase [Tuwongella immobilis]VTS07462.1 peptide deformylase : Peptide deformylase OS=Isosphaera pallida (strain ATCC 43644 / DSM 9630 / IS1B) GN=def PE=3 SV=1: Pep_deformylase [Tuwongella immobilis]